MLEPEILLLDEPFSALDPATKEHLYATLRAVHARFDCTIVFVTHDFNEARTLADRVGVVLDGRLRAVREARALFEPEELDPDVRAFLGLACGDGPALGQSIVADVSRTVACGASPG